MKKIYCILLICTLLISVVGCRENIKMNLKKEEVKLYYGNLDNSKIQWVIRPIEYSNENEKYANSIKALINGPYSSDMSRNINENTQILSIKKKKDNIYLDVSKDYLQATTDIGQLTAVMSISNTLNQFKEINGVVLSVEGKELISPKGKPYGILREFNLNEGKKVLIEMYLPDKNKKYLLPYKKEVKLDEGYILGQKLVEEIINESNQKGYNIVPKGTKLLSYSENKGIARVNLSREFNNINADANKNIDIYSIVNSLTELENINNVLFLVEEKEFEKPFSKNENIIKQYE